ncbi:MAG: outer membrane beta-barrel protein [Bacteroidota bacterium]
MKNIKFVASLIVISMLCFLQPTLAQVAEEVEVEVKQDSSKVEIVVEKNKDDDDWESDWADDDDDDDSWDTRKRSSGERVRFGMLDIGFSGYLFDDGFELPTELDELDLLYGGSVNFNWHIFRHRLPIIKRTAFLEYGLGISWMGYKFANDFKIVEGATQFETEAIDDDLRKNKLRTTFLEVPLMLTITPGRNNDVFISGGVYGGVLIGARQKIKDSSGDVQKIKDDFNLNKIRYGVEGRIGLGPISFYAQYSLQELFREDQGPALTPINIGLSVIGF